MKEELVPVIRCKNCIYFDGNNCRTGEYMKNGKPIFTHAVDRDDYCSFAEEGDYEPWGFPGENLNRAAEPDPYQSIEKEPELEAFMIGDADD